ncbi:hypothetical protein HHI36_014377 [Cryptolaemus montrouzieri]|uniref:Major facilitator superfamily (MFS) profile domain-containing protein n=1 Tax=Cryptolaemus montrouzieri TaxID=559131 RepID=A0ABD2N2U3_9CUCU
MLEHKQYDFDYFLEKVGNDGIYQKRFSILFVCIYSALATAIYYSINISLAVPNHWCKVPGREGTNFTLQEWKELTIPWKKDSLGNKEFSQCQMYSRNNTQEIIECQYGWEYDNTWFTRTLSSQYDWVCGRSSYVTDAFTFLTIGDVVGSFAFGQLGDLYGRRPIFLISTLCVVVGRILDLFTPDYWLLMILFLIGNMPSISVYQCPVVILMEISEKEKTSTITISNQVFYAIGYGIMPLVFWVCPDWVSFSLILTVPFVIYLFLYTYMVESPRWLLDRGKPELCLREMIKIAKINGRNPPQSMMYHLKHIKPEVESTYGVMSLFSTWALAKITLLLLIQGSAHMIIYVLLYLNLNNLEGNPFMNYFWQAIGEIPGHLLGKVLCDKIGRKWSRVLGFLIVISMNILLAHYVMVRNSEVIVSFSLFTLKMSLALILYSMNVAIIEMYPTALRQTGAALNYTTGCLSSLACPFFVYLATDYGKGFPYAILAGFSFLGFFTSLFLPETLHQDLPETVKDVDEFLKNQPLFFLPRRRKSVFFSPVKQNEELLKYRDTNHSV